MVCVLGSVFYKYPSTWNLPLYQNCVVTFNYAFVIFRWNWTNVEPETSDGAEGCLYSARMEGSFGRVLPPCISALSGFRSEVDDLTYCLSSCVLTRCPNDAEMEMAVSKQPLLRLQSSDPHPDPLFLAVLTPHVLKTGCSAPFCVSSRD
jgi:hypothetical protein